MADWKDTARRLVACGQWAEVDRQGVNGVLDHAGEIPNLTDWRFVGILLGELSRIDDYAPHLFSGPNLFGVDEGWTCMSGECPWFSGGMSVHPGEAVALAILEVWGAPVPPHPCLTRCWRVGVPSSLDERGKCVECGRPS